MSTGATTGSGTIGNIGPATGSGGMVTKVGGTLWVVGGWVLIPKGSDCSNSNMGSGVTKGGISTEVTATVRSVTTGVERKL